MNKTKKKAKKIKQSKLTKQTKRTKITKKTKKTNTKRYNTHHHTIHFNHKFYDRKSDILKFQYTPSTMKLKGGKFIDKGGFGCVVSPALSCSGSDINLDKSVSKIIKKQSQALSKELKISNILKKIDPGHKFYITIDNYCFIDKIPNNRTDLTNVKYKNDDLSDYTINSVEQLDIYGKKKKIDKTFCDIDLDLKPVNLIMPYAGISLSSIMKTNRKTNNIRAKMHQMFIDDLRIYFKHLVIGLIKMHTNRIANKDIKQRNIMLNWQYSNLKDKNAKNNKNGKKDINKDIMAIRYIDFGLSEFLTSEFCKDISNISLKGTPFYISPELFICSFIIKYKDQSENVQLKKINEYINKNVSKALHIINEKEMITNMSSNINTLYKKIKYLYDNNKLLETYFGSDTNKYNGYLQKADVYALGLSIYETLYKYSEINVKKNETLYDLLIHMIDINPDKRFNVVQCLSHPYFTGKK